MSRVKFGDVVKDVKINIDRLNNPYEYYVAGDHMDSEDLTIHRKGCFTTDDVGPAFIRVFKPGQILYGSRRTYLKKIAVADFEGVCANTTFVFETKDPHAFEQRLLPFIMLSKDFTTWSIAKSKGSTNPYVLFSDLADFEFELPPLEEQKVLVDKLWAAYRLKEAYKKLLVATDEMVKSQFIEMFGNPVTNTKGWKTAKIKDVAPEMPSKEQLSGKIWLLNLDMIESNTGRIIEKVYEDVENALSVQSFDEGNVLFSKLRPYLNKVVIPDEPGMATTELVPLRPEPSKLHKVFLSHLLRGNQFVNYANDIAGGTKMPRMPLTELRNFDCILPPMDKQLEFVFIAEQVDKSKFGDFKSQFIEMYYNTHNKQTLESVCPIMNKGITPKYVESSSVLVINQACIHWDGQRLGNIKYHNEEIPVRKRILESGDVLLNATGNGTLGRCCVFICPSDNNTYINDGHVIALSTDRAVILPEVLNTYLSLNDTQAEIYRQYVTGSTNQVDIVFSDIKKMKVPVPSMDEQILFVEVLTQADKSKFGDFKSQFIEMFGNPLSLNQKNELKRLGECCILNPRRPNIALCDTDKVSFIPMPAVSEDGYLVDMTDEEYGKVKKGFTYFENNDVLFAKITPCMENGKGAIVHGLTNGIGMGSTEFHVLRPINGISSPYWLLALTRMPIFRERAAKNMSGTGGQKRVSASYLDHFMVGLPAMEEQRRFEAIYRQADKSKFELKQCIENIDKVIKSLING